MLNRRYDQVQVPRTMSQSAELIVSNQLIVIKATSSEIFTGVKGRNTDSEESYKICIH